jgi:hypothetical protein
MSFVHLRPEGPMRTREQVMAEVWAVCRELGLGYRHALVAGVTIAQEATRAATRRPTSIGGVRSTVRTHRPAVRARQREQRRPLVGLLPATVAARPRLVVAPGGRRVRQPRRGPPADGPPRGDPLIPLRAHRLARQVRATPIPAATASSPRRCNGPATPTATSATRPMCARSSIEFSPAHRARRPRQTQEVRQCPRIFRGVGGRRAGSSTSGGSHNPRSEACNGAIVTRRASGRSV